MKKIFIFLIVVLIIFVVILGSLGIYINIKGKDLLVGFLRKQTKSEVKISQVKFIFPASVKIEDFSTPPFSFKEAKLSLGWINPFTRSLLITKVYLDGVNLEISQNTANQMFTSQKPPENTPVNKEVSKTVKKNVPPASSAIRKKNSKKTNTQPAAPFYITINNLKISNSSLNVTVKREENILKLLLEGIHLNVKNITYPLRKKFTLNFKSSLALNNKQMKDAVHIKGWCDYPKKNMDIKAEVNNFDYFAARDLYPDFLKPENLGIKEAQLSLKTDIISVRDDMNIQGLITVEKIKFSEAESNNTALLKSLLGMFKNKDNKYSFSFKIRTLMSSPKFDFSSLGKSIFKQTPLAAIIPVGINKVKNVISGTIKSTTSKATKAVSKTSEVAVDVPVKVIKNTAESIIGTFKSIIKDETNGEETNKDKKVDDNKK